MAGFQIANKTVAKTRLYLLLPRQELIMTESLISLCAD